MQLLLVLSVLCVTSACAQETFREGVYNVGTYTFGKGFRYIEASLSVFDDEKLEVLLKPLKESQTQHWHFTKITGTTEDYQISVDVPNKGVVCAELAYDTELEKRVLQLQKCDVSIFDQIWKVIPLAPDSVLNKPVYNLIKVVVQDGDEKRFALQMSEIGESATFGTPYSGDRNDQNFVLDPWIASVDRQ